MTMIMITPQHERLVQADEIIINYVFITTTLDDDWAENHVKNVANTRRGQGYYLILIFQTAFWKQSSKRW